MAVAPKLPKLAPEDMHWARWVTNKLKGHADELERVGTRIQAANTQRATVSSQTSNNTQQQATTTTVGPKPPVGDPQTPTAPILSSDHATITIRWDGQVTKNGATDAPAQGFNYVTVQRSTDTLNYVTVGTHLGLAGTIVDTDVTVGTKYSYRFYTTDTLNRRSPVSGVASIVAQGVDKGSLDADLAATLDDIQHSATSGGLIQYSDTAPTDPAYHASTALWFDTSDPSGAVPKRWDTTTNSWVAVPYGQGALGPGSIVASKILAGAIDTNALGANAVTANKISAGAITAEKLGADSVTANAIVAGSIDADKLAVGAVQAKNLSVSAAPPTGTQINRVPKDLTDNNYWSAVINNSIKLFDKPPKPIANVTASANGVYVKPNGYITMTAANKVPISRQVHVSWTTTGFIYVNVNSYNASMVQINATAVTNNAVFTLPTTAVYYGVTLELNSEAAQTVSQLAVFEVIGDATGSKQAAQLSPSGLRLFNDAGQLAIDLTTNNTNFFTILNNNESVITLSEDGSGVFDSIQVNDDYYASGDPVIGGFADFSRADGTLDGPLLERVPRGIQYSATWDTMDNFTVASRYQRIATGSFSLDPNRAYMFTVDLGGLQTTNNSGVNVYVELQFSTDQLADVTSGTPVARSVVYNGDTGYFALPPVYFNTPTGAAFSSQQKTLPPSSDIYWQINTNLSATPTTSYLMHQYAYSTAFDVIDIGPNISVLDGTDRTTSGGTATGSAGSGSGGNSTGSGSSTSKTTTKTWDATWSASWNQGGSNKVTGSGTYDDANKLYQGFGASNMGSKFGFPASVATTLSGKTISKVEIFLQNRWTYYNAGGTATFAAHGNSSAGATFGSTSGSTFTRSFDRGQGRWLNIGNTEIPFSQWKSGSTRGMALVVQGGSGNYAYYDGVGKSKPPKLRITYK